MNIKSDTLNPTSLVLGGPSLDSYHLLWFIRRCMCLFDVLSWEVLHLLEKKKSFENKRWICQTVKNDSNRRKICVALVRCMCECVFSIPKGCCAVLTYSVVRTKSLFVKQKSTFFFSLMPVLVSVLTLWSCTSCILSITYSLKMWLEKRVAMEMLQLNHIYQRFFFSVYSFANYN